MEPVPQPRTEIRGIPGRWALVIWSFILFFVVPILFRKFSPFKHPLAVEVVLEGFIAFTLISAICDQLEMLRHVHRILLYLGHCNIFGQAWVCVQLYSLHQTPEYKNSPKIIQESLVRHSAARLAFLVFGFALSFVALTIMPIALADMKERRFNEEEEEDEDD